MKPSSALCSLDESSSGLNPSAFIADVGSPAPPASPAGGDTTFRPSKEFEDSVRSKSDFDTSATMAFARRVVVTTTAQAVVVARLIREGSIVYASLQPLGTAS